MTNIDEIYQASKVGYSDNAKSIVDVILDSKWSSVNKLDDAYEWLEQQTEPSAIAFFQLPFPILLPKYDIKYSLSRIELPKPLISFELIGSELNTVSKKNNFKIKKRKNFDEDDQYINARLKNEKIGVINRTQVTIKFKLWRFWKDYYDQYHNAYLVNGDVGKLLQKLPIGATTRHLIDTEGVPITAGKYEYDLKKRLRLESLHIINKIIKYYSVACRHSLPHEFNSINNFFIMLEGGRLSALGPGSSMITNEVDALPTTQFNKNLKSLSKYLDNGRDISIYERYILNAINLLEDGSYNLSIVYVAMILEWFANEIIDDNLEKVLKKQIENPKLVDLCIDKIWRKTNKKNKGKVHNKLRNYERFTRYFPAIGIEIPQSLEGKVTSILNYRNSVIHGDQTQQIDEKYVSKAIDDALIFIDHVMKQLLKK